MANETAVYKHNVFLGSWIDFNEIQRTEAEYSQTIDANSLVDIAFSDSSLSLLSRYGTKTLRLAMREEKRLKINNNN